MTSVLYIAHTAFHNPILRRRCCGKALPPISPFPSQQVHSESATATTATSAEARETAIDAEPLLLGTGEMPDGSTTVSTMWIALHARARKREK